MNRLFRLVSIPAARLAAFAVTFILVVPALRCLAGDDWQVPEARIRYRLELSVPPRYPSAGYFVHLPDGGILGGKAPSTIVMTEEGETVPSFLLWNNSASGFDIVFAVPVTPAEQVYVYMRPDRAPKIWNPDSGLTPGQILCVKPGSDSLADAYKLGKFGQIEPEVHSLNNLGMDRAPLSIGGNETGRRHPASFYLLSHLYADRAGKYWIGVGNLAGSTEVFVGGSKISPRESSPKFGIRGETIELKQGMHRVEIFQTAPAPRPDNPKDDTNGLVYLAWKAPDLEADVIGYADIAESGSGKVAAVEARDGAPVACIRAVPGLTYWFEGEEPLIIYELQAEKTGGEGDTTFIWEFPGGAKLPGEQIAWLLPGLRETPVKLTVKNAKGTSETVLSIFGYSTVGTSLEKPEDRKAFRNVLGRMLEVSPSSAAVSAWTSAYWNNLVRTAEWEDDSAMLSRIFDQHAEAARKKLGAAQIDALQDLFLDQMQRDNPGKAAEWTRKFLTGATDFSRRQELQIREAELLMFYLGDQKTAEKNLMPLAGVSSETGDRAKVRLGDLAFLGGDLNKATTYYATVQTRARSRRNLTPAPASGSPNPLRKGEAKKSNAPEQSQSPLSLADRALARRAGALQEVSLSENVRSLTEGGFLLEARQALRAWETEFPLSKISGDFVIREAALSMKARDWKRAHSMLEAYCREIDASSFLPEAARMLITCAREQKEPPASIHEVLKKVKTRLEYHPVAAELEEYLSGGAALPP